MEYDFGIIGGGWAGLLSAYNLKQRYPMSRVIVFESSSENKLGGLLHSEKIEGMTFDTGGPHILFSKNKEILDRNISFLKDNVYNAERKGAIYFEGQFLKYPFENGIFELPPERRAKIGLGIIQSLLKNNLNPDWAPANFREWIYGFFGDEMGKSYLEPYNKKIWKRNLSTLDADWVFSPGRLPFPVLEDLVFAISGIETIGYKEQSNFYYPRIGGIQAMYNSLLSIIKKMGVSFVTSFPIKDIRKEKKIWSINGRIRSNNIVNTIPLPEFLRITGQEDVLKRYSNMFDYNSVAVVGFGFNRKGGKHHAVYVPDESIAFHRYTWMSNLTTDTPPGKSNLIAETTFPMQQCINSEEVIEKTIKGLEKIGIINDEREVMFKAIWLNKYGYPIYVRNHSKMRSELLEFLHARGLYSVGRWGSWQYWNTDKVHEATILEINKTHFHNHDFQS